MRTLFISLIVFLLSASAFATKIVVPVTPGAVTSIGDTITAADTVDFVFPPNGSWGSCTPYVVLDSVTGSDNFSCLTMWFPASVLQADMIPDDDDGWFEKSQDVVSWNIDTLSTTSKFDSVYWETASGDSDATIAVTPGAFYISKETVMWTGGLWRWIVGLDTCSYQIHLVTFKK